MSGCLWIAGDLLCSITVPRFKASAGEFYLNIVDRRITERFPLVTTMSHYNLFKKNPVWAVSVQTSSNKCFHDTISTILSNHIAMVMNSNPVLSMLLLKIKIWLQWYYACSCYQLLIDFMQLKTFPFSISVF